MFTRAVSHRALATCAALAFTIALAGCGSTHQAAPLSAPAASQPAARPAASPPATKPLHPVTLMLDWTLEGDHAPFFYGIAEGMYRQAGLDVKIEPGKGSISTIEQVAQGNADFGFADMSATAVAITQGVKVKVIDGYFQKSPFGIVTLAKSNINRPADLLGKTVAYSPGGLPTGIISAFEAANHLDPQQMHIQSVPPAAQNAALGTGKVDAIITSTITVVPYFDAQKTPTHTLLFADYGVALQGHGIVVSRSLLQSQPDVVRAFVQASNAAWAAAEAHQQEAITVEQASGQPVQDGAPGTLKLALQLLHTANTEGKPIGWMSDKDWTDSLATLQEYAGLKGVLPLSDYYTDEFVSGQG